MRGVERQSQIYVGGVSGRRPRVPVDPAELERRAEGAMSEKAFAYVAAGAGLEETIRANREAFGRWRIVPRMLRDVSERDTSVELFGRRIPYPFLLAPIGVLELAHREAERAVAPAAASTGIPMVFSNQASTPMEAVAGLLGDSPRWFQLYWSTSNDLVESLVERAEGCGCEAIVVTLDTTVLGWRTRDLELAYLPFLRGKGIAQYTSDPVFQQQVAGDLETFERDTGRVTPSAVATLVQMARAHPGRFRDTITSDAPVAAVRRFIRTFSKASLDWDDVAFLREHTDLPLLLKGVEHPDDARRARDLGVDGVIVSNHGGRQIDGAIGALDALPGVADAVGDDLTVLFDSGVRCGADVFTALALGARAVCLGRPYVHGLAVAGGRGVAEVIANVLSDLEMTMALSGCSEIADITAARLVRTDAVT